MICIIKREAFELKHLNYGKNINIKSILSMIRYIDSESFTLLLISWHKRQKHTHPKQVHNLKRKIIRKREKSRGKRPHYTMIEKWALMNNSAIRDNDILDGLFPKRKKQWVSPLKRKALTSELDIVNFSFIDNPNETLSKFAAIAESEVEYPINSFKLNFRDTTITDISPYLLLGSIWSDLFPFIAGGFMDNHLKKIMKPLGLDKYLNMNIHDDGSSDPNIIALPVLTKEHEDNEVTATKTEARDIVSTRICDQFNTWLRVLCHGKPSVVQLSQAGKGHFVGMIGEVLENAEKHAEPEKGIGFGKWSATCCMEYQPQQDTYRCCISFFNKGQSIADTISNATDPKIKNDLKDYVKKHSNQTDGKVLSTIFAIQDLNTRETKVASQGGLGMMHMVHFIQQIGNKNTGKTPQIVIISGDTYVKFSDNYMATKYDNAGKRNQWFNADNSSDYPPDASNAFRLKNKISGTIITARFFLDKGMVKDE